MKKTIHQWWNISPNKKSYNLYNGKPTRKDLKNIDNPFKIKDNEK